MVAEECSTFLSSSLELACEKVSIRDLVVVSLVGLVEANCDRFG